jgi:hypothetical protein
VRRTPRSIRRPSRAYIALAAGTAATLAAGCAPPFATLQSARTVPPGRVELTPSYSAVSATYEGETNHYEDVYGVQLAVGITVESEFRFAYARVDLDPGSGVNVLGFGPKLMVVPDHVAVYIPAGFAFGDAVVAGGIDEGFDSMDTWQLQPTLLFTGRLHENVEIDPSTKFILPLSNGGDPQVALNLGFGLSSDLDLWALRPEIGFLFNPGDDGFHTSYSIAVSITPPR